MLRGFKRLMFAAVVSVLVQAETKPIYKDVPWASCIENLELPTDSALASFMRGTSSVRAVITFSSNGAPGIRLEGGTTDARREVSDLFALSRFRGAACARKVIALEFTFVVKGAPVLEIYPPRTTFQSPNHFTFYFRPRGPYSDYPPPPLQPQSVR